ncbi:MAG: hypothetical protein HQ567_31530 [Candidatus Nealsonbacteria bacterium]|nr:hypothetical protein [Candidatus Nealsonbacteria bacterium]
MSRIGTTLSGIERTLLNRLADANAAATLSSLRIASGRKINSPSDDPTAFVRLSGLQSRLSEVTAATSNVSAAGSIVSQSQTTLDEVRTQLDLIRTELVKDEGRTLSQADRDAGQVKIDAALAQINLLASTQIDGRRRLDGSGDFAVSGRDSAQVADLRVHTTGGAALPISAQVTATATQAQLTYTGKAGLATVVTDATFTITGDLGSAEYTVSEDDLLSGLVTLINNDSHKTGVTASLTDDDLTLTSVKYGTNADIAVTATFAVTGGNGDGTANGTDATAYVNGLYYTGDGNRFTVTQNQTRFEIEFAAGHTGNIDQITVTGDAMTFATTTDLDRRATLSIPGLQTARLGGLSGSLDQLLSGGLLSGLDDKTSQAIRVVDEALGDLTRIEGAVDGFYNASITSAANLLSDMQTDLESAIDDVDLVDTSEEAAKLALYTDLASNALSGLSIIQSQRSSIVVVLRKIAGLT